jgi:DnaK suppressor protein
MIIGPHATDPEESACAVLLNTWPETGLEMDRRELDRYKYVLLAKRGELSVQNADGESRVPAAGGWDGDPADQANADAEAELQILLYQTDGRLLKAVEAALSRIRQGTFGICEVCLNPISRARLEAVPWTHLCRDCKQQEASVKGAESRNSTSAQKETPWKNS